MYTRSTDPTTSANSIMLSLSIRRVSAAAFVAAVAAAPLAATLAAQANAPVDPRLYSALTWRNLGPFRGGRVAAVSGVVGEPGTFYIGLPSAGVWKTTSAGETWYPVFDAVKNVSSVGAVDVAPSDPNVIYVGTGDIITGGAINEGNGVYKSTDAGRTWRHLGLDATKQIPTIVVDPQNPNVVLVGAQGDIHVKSHDRGVFRSTDGGATWTQTLFVDDSTGLQRLARAYDTPNVIFATTVAHYQPPPAPRGTAPGGFGRGGNQNGPTSTKLFKSTDGGVSWKEITGGGLPRLTGKAWVSVANTTSAQRVYVIGDWGLFRSDDGGASWHQMAADDQRIRNGQGGYNCGVYVDPQNPDVVYTLNTASYRSTDGGRTFTGFKGAPGGDDPQQMWIDPTNGKRMLFGYDQGAIVSLDGGGTWSSWYNQNTEQIYHLSVDNSFPYWVYGSQQDAGAIRTRSRGNQGEITPLDWNPVPGWEWGTIIPDPLDNNTVYASGSGILKISYPSEEWINVSPAQDPSRKLRTAFSQPIVFAPWNKHMLIAGFQSLWSSVDGGAHWTSVSPDLGVRADGPTPPTAPGINAPPGGAIESIGASTVGQGLIWVGTNNGLIKVTRDGGKTWSGGAIDGIPNEQRAEVLTVEPSHFDAATAYAVLDLHRIGDYTPYIYRTHDYGKTWTRITQGLPVNQPSGSFARVLRNDTRRKGLLFAGTESGMNVSFDDGDQWQTFQQNLPTTSYRDLTIKGNDLVASTYGRGFWVLDDYSTLRQAAPAIASEPAHLFKPGDAPRVRRNVGADTPFPPEVPHALNPPDGVIIDYWLAQAPSSDITLDVLDASGAVVRHLTSAPGVPVPEAARPPHPNFWVAPPMSLPKNAGSNRTNWDLRYDPPNAFSHSFEINANPGITPPSPEGPLALPGTYTLKLTVDGHSYTQTAAITADPRSPASLMALREQHALQMKLEQGINATFEGHRMATALRDALRGAVPTDAQPELTDVAARTNALIAQLDTVVGLDAGRRAGRGNGGTPAPTFRAINGAMVAQLNAQENGDQAPTAAALAQFAANCKELTSLGAAWERLSTRELGGVNALLKQRGRTVVVLPTGTMRLPSCTGM
jgi:photosystem II stability/assembly factor-like uncharacterized protein